MKIRPPEFVALIATCDRPRLLAERALPSVAAQRRRPDGLIVADDSKASQRARNQKTVSEFSARTGIRARYVENHRAAGASGCWNSGAMVALREFGELNESNDVYLAILDDDDEWLPHHLENAAAWRAARDGAVDYFGASHERLELTHRMTITAPQRLVSGGFLTGHSQIIGSAMMFRLSAFMRAGMFDEALPACTDRDLNIRMSYLPDINYVALRAVSVLHHADNTRRRLSNPGGEKKMAGLARFWDKYRGWMSETEQRACAARAARLFGWRGADAVGKIPARASNTKRMPKYANNANEQIALIVGVIVDPKRACNPLFDDLARLAKDKRLSSLDVVVIPCADSHARALQKSTAAWRGMGLRMHCVDNAAIDAILRALNIPAARGMRAIALNRMILQYAASEIRHVYRAPVYWILDGDVRLHGLTIKRGKLRAFQPDYVGEMLRLRTRCDVAVGGINGAAPLPRALSVRAQLVDLLHFCAQLNKPSNARRFPARTIANAARGEIAADYYHDCGGHPHLEQPVGLLPLPANCSHRRFVRELPRLLNRVLAGDAVTRPLIEHAAMRPNAWLHRGGNTLIFNAKVLRQCPNGLVRGAFIGMRRQDEIWCSVGKAVFGWRFADVANGAAGRFPVTQTRAHEPPQAPDMRRVQADIIGHAITSAFRQTLAGKKFADVEQLAAFILQDGSDFFPRVRELACIRRAKARASFVRIAGIAETMRGMLANDAKTRDQAETQKALAVLRDMEKRFARAVLPEDLFGDAGANDKLREAIADLPSMSRQFNDLSGDESLKPWVRKERRKNAKRLLAKIAGENARLRFLGSGDEGVVFTDNFNVYKVLHQWYSVQLTPDIPYPNFFCDKLQGKRVDWNPATDALYPVLKRWRAQGDLVLMMPFEKTDEYAGGCGASWVAMLSELRRRGIVLWNFTPRNLRQKGDRVRLIDYGHQIHPFTEKDFDLSARKAWLCCHHAGHKDLRKLLTKSLTDANFPQLEGYARMREAAKEYATKFRIADTAVREIIGTSAKRALDYGCGNGRDAVTLAEAGIDATAYDPNLSTKAKRRLKDANVRQAGKKRLATAAPFDAILVRHVMCEIRSDRELTECLRDLYRLIDARGKVVVTACDMDVKVKEKLHAVNLMPRGADCDSKFFYRKKIRKNDSVRPHVHRPQAMLENMFAQVGFEIQSCQKFPDLDLENFQPCGGVLQWTLVPRTCAGKKARAS